MVSAAKDAYVAQAAGAAVWTRGTIASEPALDYESKPCFLVDARGRDGQSGSPVIGYWPSTTKHTVNGNIRIGGDESWELLGVYSGRLTPQSDLGRIWKRSAIREIVRGTEVDSNTWE